MSFVKGIDTSTYQDNSATPQRIDWLKPAGIDVKFTINRVTFCASLDEDFTYNWDQQRGKYLRGAYGFWGYWSGAPAVDAQVKAVVDALKSDPGEMPVIWCDVEKANSNYPDLPVSAVALPVLKRYMEGIEDGLGMGTGLYTNLTGIQRLSPIPQWLLDKPLWIAWPLSPSTGETVEAFIERTGIRPPLKAWSNFKIWQYSWKGPGKEAGMESYGLDMDYFNGSEEELRAWCKTSTQGDTSMTYPMGIVTAKSGWSKVNPAFQFTMHPAYIIKPDGTLDANPELKPLEDEAKAKGIPSAILWDFLPWIYSEQQQGEPNWPNEASDYQFQKFIGILAARSYNAVVVRFTTYKDRAGKVEDPGFLSFGAQTFMNRVQTWLRANGKGNIPLILAAGYQFISAFAPRMNNWVHNFPNMAVQSAIKLESSYPVSGSKPNYLGNSTECPWWQYFDVSSQGWSLVVFRGENGYPADVTGMNKWLNISGTVTPPPPTPEPNTDLEKRVAALELQMAKLKTAFQ